jgi:hypothetical protein
MALASAVVVHGTLVWGAGLAAAAGAKPTASAMIPPTAAALASVCRDRWRMEVPWISCRLVSGERQTFRPHETTAVRIN